MCGRSPRMAPTNSPPGSIPSMITSASSLGGDTRRHQVLGAQAGRADREQTDLALRGEQLGQQQQARRHQRHRYRVLQLTLEQHQKAATGGDGQRALASRAGAPRQRSRPAGRSPPVPRHPAPPWPRWRRPPPAAASAPESCPDGRCLPGDAGNRVSSIRMPRNAAAAPAGPAPAAPAGPRETPGRLARELHLCLAFSPFTIVPERP